MLIAVVFYCLYLPALVRCLPFRFSQLFSRADPMDLDLDFDDDDDDGATVGTGTQNAGSGTSAGDLASPYKTTVFLANQPQEVAPAGHESQIPVYITGYATVLTLMGFPISTTPWTLLGTLYRLRIEVPYSSRM